MTKNSDKIFTTGGNFIEGFYYNAEANVQLLIYLMKAHGIKKVIISPGATNIAFVGSIQQDPYFEIYSSVDERSAAYMACGMAAESGEPVALSCTGATASRNYLPGLTEAFYRKLPVLAITSSQSFRNVGNLIPQVIDRSAQPKDVVRTSLFLPVSSEKGISAYVSKVNSALLELRRHGGGPVHINLETGKSKDFSVKELPKFRVIRRYFAGDKFPEMPKDARIAISVGAHKPFTKELEETIDKFCAAYDAVVLIDHSSSYKGKYKVLPTILACQRNIADFEYLLKPDLLIHIGEHSGDYYTLGRLKGKDVWRISPDGEIRNTFGKLTKVFEMSEQVFFSRYVETAPKGEPRDEYLKAFLAATKEIYAKIPELPFSNIWVAKTTAPKLPEGCVLHLGVSNTMRSWTFYELSPTIMSNANLGCRGIDGALSSALGMSLANKNRIHFCMLGDLTFFYDMNALGNRYVGNNLRILLVNNGRGTEFRMYNHYAAIFGDEADPFIAAAGHFGNKSPDLVRHYAQDLGFEYLTASNKEEFLQKVNRFVSPETLPKPILFEVFTQPKEESDALRAIRSLIKATPPKADEPKADAPKVETPEVDAPKADAKPLQPDEIKIEFKPLQPDKIKIDAKPLQPDKPEVVFETVKKNNLIPSKKARLGFGILRLPLLENKNIDVEECRRMVDEYMKGDFCYFDTHPSYCKRQSQSIIRELVVKRYPREKFLLADKMPWPIKAPSEYERIFAAELKDCSVEYFDYYLLHALDAKHYAMHEKMGGFEFLKKLKAQGLVRRIGFSFHDKPEVLEKILAAHPEIEFVQLQINYLDWEDPFYQSRKLYETAKKFGKQITVMEPIKGGALANLEKVFQFDNSGTENFAYMTRKFANPLFASMALKFVASLDVDIILSGMSALEHVIENRKTLAEPVTLSEDDRKFYPQILDVFKAARLIPCTACRYCESECPKNIAIPDILSLINLCQHTGENDKTFMGRFKRNYGRWTFRRGKASDCIACGRCANRCPQKINIPEHMKEAKKLFEGK